MFLALRCCFKRSLEVTTQITCGSGGQFLSHSRTVGRLTGIYLVLPRDLPLSGGLLLVLMDEHLAGCNDVTPTL